MDYSMCIEESPNVISKHRESYKINFNVMLPCNVEYSVFEFVSLAVLWNEYQIFVYNDLKFEQPIVILPDFKIKQLLIVGNFLVCVDSQSIVRYTELRNLTQRLDTKNFKIAFGNAVKCIKFNMSYILSIVSEKDAYFLTIHTINTELKLFQKSLLTQPKEHWPIPKTSFNQIVFKYHTLERDHTLIRKILKSNQKCLNLHIIVISFDKLNLYYCLLNQDILEESLHLTKLYTSPSEINDVEINQTLDIIVGLTMGSVIKLSFEGLTQNVVHLNAPLYKFVAIKDSLIYTDGLKMFKTQRTFFEDITIKEYFVKNIKDFIFANGKVICTTFHNFIYVFSYDEEDSFFKPNDYCSSNEVLKNSEYLKKTFEEINKYNEIVKKIELARNNVAALALSKRPDITDELITVNFMVYECYEDIIKNDLKFTFCDETNRCFEQDTFFILINIIPSENLKDKTIADVFSNLLMNATLSSQCKLIKTISLKIDNKLETKSILIATPSKIFSDHIKLEVNLEIVKIIPGTYEKNDCLWTTIYRKLKVLGPENFIKTKRSQTNYFLYNENVDIDQMILKAAQNQHGELFDITDLVRSAKKWSVYLRLPKNYESLLSDPELMNNFRGKNLQLTLHKLTSKKFLKSECDVNIEVANSNCVVRKESYGTWDALVIKSENLKLIMDLRKFFSDLFFKTVPPEMRYVPHSLYNAIETLMYKVKNLRNNFEVEDFHRVADCHELNVIGNLPL